jgi:hypothetical protein
MNECRVAVQCCSDERDKDVSKPKKEFDWEVMFQIFDNAVDAKLQSSHGAQDITKVMGY